MKERIKIDSSLLMAIVILTGFLYFFPNLYSTNQGLDNVLDFLGFMTILKGTLLRMSGRGHKKSHSKQSGSLVTTGPYSYVRNPMYLGSFLIGAGFVLIVWPWWSLPIFACLFYLRFKKEVVKEEGQLSEMFGKNYADYCQKTPRLFAGMNKSLKSNASEIFNLKESFITEEKFGLLAWPILAVLLETFQESVIFQKTDVNQTIIIFLWSAIIFSAALGISFIVMKPKTYTDS